MLEHRITVVITLALLLYFLWMDVALFYHVHNKSAGRTIENTNSPSTTTSFPQLISPFTGLSVKMMMMDQVNNYIHTPLAHIFNEVTHFSSVFYFITPNMVSFVGLLFAVGAAKCMSMEARIFHFIAIFLFQMRTWFDALDGIVARSRLGMVQHVSLRNTSGYVVDGVADTLGFAAFLVGCFYYLRSTAHKHKHYLPLNSNDAFGDVKNGNSPSQHSNSVSSTTRRVFFVVLCFGLQLALSAFFWTTT
uniref:Uncharacterized protein n=1 Tax=Cyriopagopus schmidti TaxID=29017 RepID=B5M6F6_CYRSC|nr:unknown [Cyriopagopus schmidti]